MLALTLKKRLLLFVCVFLVCFFIVSVLATVVTWKFGTTTPSLRIVTVLQDVILFVLPPAVTALLVTRQPATLLCIDKKPKLYSFLVSVCVLIVSMPAMNYVIMLNNQLPLPDGIASTLRAMENQAEATVAVLNGPHTVPNLIMTLLIVAVFAGLSEELLFRGGLQRLLTTGGVNPHAAIWVTAALFSLMHMQFYGFVPRMLLGAFFGYTLYWTGSLWIPILLHIINNAIFVLSEWFTAGSNEPSPIDTLGDGSEFFSIILSIILVVIGLKYLKKISQNP